MSNLKAILDNPQFHDYIPILKGARNGLVYGVKVRFPHALVMAILFGRGNWQTRLKAIFRATRQHATNLAQFVAMYKTFLLVQRKLNGGKQRTHDTFFAGLLGGYLVFGERNAINEQIVLYVCSRVVASFLPRAGPPRGLATTGDATVKLVPPDSRYFSLFAAISWGAVMWLFQHRGETLQPGMFNAMTYLYRASER
ncbi:peroxisomal membrane protein 4 [Lactifluus subvellereus]|nr:peroxisomal membrane protein 4 [Lactifluus subvellereus]